MDTHDEDEAVILLASESEAETLVDLQNFVREVDTSDLLELIFRQLEIQKLFDRRCLTTCENTPMYIQNKKNLITIFRLKF